MNISTVSVVNGLVAAHGAINGYNPITTGRVAAGIFYAGLLLLCSYAAGIPDLPRNARQGLRAALAATGVALVSVSLVQLATGTQMLPRVVSLGSALILTPLYGIAAKISAEARVRRGARDKILLVGTRDEADELTKELHDAAQKPATLVRFLTVEAAAKDGSLLNAGLTDQPTVVVLSQQAEIDPEIISQAGDLHLRGVRLRSIAGFWEEWLGRLPVSELQRRSLFFDISEIHRAPYRPLKRVLDLVAGGVALLVVLAIAPVVALLNLRWNPGPLLYRQIRTGKGGVPVTIFKFRTMKIGPQGASTWTSEDDERITPFGRILRTTHLDELPQAINLVRGDLSVVGPRPEQPHYVAQLSEEIPFYDVRHAVRPGLTGWAQVNFTYAASTDDALEKLQYEFYYLRHQRLLLDLRIIGRTIRSVFGASGR